jgi:hypothetical protein
MYHLLESTNVFHIVLGANSICVSEQLQPAGLCRCDGSVLTVRYELNYYINLWRSVFNELQGASICFIEHTIIRTYKLSHQQEVGTHARARTYTRPTLKYALTTVVNCHADHATPLSAKFGTKILRPVAVAKSVYFACGLKATHFVTL